MIRPAPRPISRIALLALLLSATAIGAEAPGGDLDPKPASAATRAAQQAVAASLPAEDGRDADFAQRGFVATRADPVIRNAQGKPVWNIAAYQFVTGPAPASVNSSLWREIGLTDRKEVIGIDAGKTVLIARLGQPVANPAVIIRGPRRLILGLLFLKMPLAQLEAAGLEVEGDPDAIAALQAALDPVPSGFTIAEP